MKLGTQPNLHPLTKFSESTFFATAGQLSAAVLSCHKCKIELKIYVRVKSIKLKLGTQLKFKALHKIPDFFFATDGQLAAAILSCQKN